jgi:hypothetical protein
LKKIHVISSLTTNKRYSVVGIPSRLKIPFWSIRSRGIRNINVRKPIGRKKRKRDPYLSALFMKLKSRNVP